MINDESLLPNLRASMLGRAHDAYDAGLSVDEWRERVDQHFAPVARLLGRNTMEAIIHLVWRNKRKRRR